MGFSKLLVLLWVASYCFAQTNVSQPTPVKNAASGTSGSVAPTISNNTAGISSTGLTPITVCNSFFQGQMTTATTTQFVALSGTTRIRVCSYQVQGSTTATATTFKLVSGTGANCVTGPTNLTPAWSFPASNTIVASMGFGGIGEIFQTPAGAALCGTNSLAGTVNVLITYTQY